MQKCKVDFDSSPWETPQPGERFKAFEHEGQRLRLVELAAGFVQRDWCARGHIGYVLEGEMDLDFEGETVRFSRNDGLFIPAGEDTRHKANVLSDVVRLILVEDA